MGEKKYKRLRQRLGYKPQYKMRKYSLLDRIYTLFKRGKWITGKKIQRVNVAQRHLYRLAKKEMKARRKGWVQ